MHFAHSIWLVAGLITCGGLAYGFRRFQKRNASALRRFASGHLLEKLTESVSSGRRMTRYILIILAIASIFLALARPQVGYRWKEVKRRGIDILMAVDTSKSMLANDVKPNRLERSKLGIMEFVSRLEGDRVGLIPFSGTAFLMCPLTLDYEAFKQSLMALDTGIIPAGGTDLASAIREAEVAFSGNSNHKILVLITDGEDLEGAALDAAKQAAGKGMTIYTVGVGTPAGELIPIEKPGGGVSFVKDEQGQVVKSRLDEKRLREIAKLTHGLYEPLGRQAEGLDAIYEQRLSLVPKQELAERMRKVPIDRFEWPLIFGLILLIIEFIMTDRKGSPRTIPVIKTAGRWPLVKRKAATMGLLALIVPAFLLQPKDLHASPRSAEKAYIKGDYPRALKEYKAATEKAPEDYKLRFNLGTAAYKNRKYRDAQSAFKRALKSPDLSLQNQAYYNLGNTLYRQGQRTEKSAPQATISQWQAAIDAYGSALKLNPEDEDARFNQEFVKKRLEKLKKGQKQNSKKNKHTKKGDRGKKKGKGKGKDKKDKSKHGSNQDGKGNKDKTRSARGKDQKGPKRLHSNNRDINPGAGQKDSKDIGQPRPKGQGEKTLVSMASRRHRPGKMSSQEAKNLLDSLKGDERSMPVFFNNMGQMKGKEKKRRDW